LFINTTSIGGLLTVPFNSTYHATKWALEGWSESMAFELNEFGIAIKTIEPGGMKTDFFTRSFDTGRHPAYDVLVNKVMSVITDSKQMATYSSPEEIAEVEYEAATDGKDHSAILLGQTQKRCTRCACSLGKKHSARQWLSSFLAMHQKRLSFRTDSLRSLVHGKPRFHPALFAFGVVRHVFVAHRRQFTGSVFAGVSMRACAVGDDLRVLLGL
jgi:hypothetical protein